MSLKPVNDRIIVKKLESKKTTASGILLVTNNDTHLKVKVIAVSNGYWKRGKFHKIPVKVDDILLLAEKSGVEVTIDNEKLLVIREEDVMAVVNE